MRAGAGHVGIGVPRVEMATYELAGNQAPPAECREGVLSIGNFDGVHLGHIALLEQLRGRADALAGPAVAVTFDPHPLQVLRPATFRPLLTTPSDRAALLQSNGADHSVILHVAMEFFGQSAVEFFHRIIREHFAARGLVEGPNFGFGHNREGDVDTLRTLCHSSDIELTVVPPVLAPDGAVVSSSRVRQALEEGDPRRAASLLGRPYRLRGRVGKGQRRGQTLGFPTANLVDMPTLVPGDGVYAVLVHDGSFAWPGAANVGGNPTFAQSERKVEVHLAGFDGDLYDHELAVDFVERLRDTRPFASPDLLAEQLRRDVERAVQAVQTRA